MDWATQPINDLLLILSIVAGGGAIICLMKIIPHATQLGTNTGQSIKGIGFGIAGVLLCIAVAGGTLIHLAQTAQAPATVQNPISNTGGSNAPAKP